MRHDRDCITLAAAVSLLLAGAWSQSAAGQTAPAPSPQPVAPRVPNTVTSPIAITRPPLITNPNLQIVPPPPPPPMLRGFVDLHTHPVDNVAFGGRLMYGGVDGLTVSGVAQGAYLPIDPNCNHKVLAGSEAQALGHDNAAHGGYDLLSNQCGNVFRPAIIHGIQFAIGKQSPDDARGWPDFRDWPTWDDVTHQKMWVDWVRRAYNGGLRVMVALATNSKTLGDLVTIGNLSDTPDEPTDDLNATDKQIDEIKRWVSHHPDFMEVAYKSQDVRDILGRNHLAVVIGVEVDHIGNFQPSAPPSDAIVRGEIDRLYDEGVRYIFPLHILDNAFGGTATYEDFFNVSNVLQDGAPWALMCAKDATDSCSPSPATSGKCITYQFAGDIGKWGAQIAAKLAQWGVPTPHGDPSCSPLGQKNSRGLTASGITAIKEMMRLGMLIDIDHMSQFAADQTLALASDPAVRYPLNSGHNAIRGDVDRVTQGVHSNTTERNFRPDQYATIGSLHGMAGVGNQDVDAWQWLRMYNDVIQAMSKGAPNTMVVGAFGTDTNGLTKGAPAPQNHPPIQFGPGWPASLGGPGLPMAADGQKTWDYNAVGFAHYGLLPDFLQDARNSPPIPAESMPPGTTVVDSNFMFGADYFFHTWRIAETQSAQLPWQPKLISSIATVIGQSPPLTVALTVTDATTKQPVPGMQVWVQDVYGRTQSSANTAADGTVRLPFAPCPQSPPWTIPAVPSPGCAILGTPPSGSRYVMLNSWTPVLAATGTTTAQNSLSLNVSDPLTKTQVAGASVNLLDSQGHTLVSGTTAPDGTANLSLAACSSGFLVHCNATVVIAKPGYLSCSLPVPAVAGQTRCH